jgi:hypothetical protein
MSVQWQQSDVLRWHWHLQAWNLTGDVYSTHPGDKPWISEMYGYSFGAAKANVWHRYHTTAMIYPGYQPIGAVQQM